MNFWKEMCTFTFQQSKFSLQSTIKKITASMYDLSTYNLFLYWTVAIQQGALNSDRINFG